MEDNDAEAPTLGPTAEHVLGRRVSVLRRARGWSQDELAQLMVDAGFSWRQTTVAKTEKADRPIRVNEAAALARIFETQVEHLVAPDQPALMERLNKARQQLAAVEAEAARHQAEAARSAATRTFAEARVDTLESLASFWRNRNPETLVDAVIGVRCWFTDEWHELLAEAGVPRDVSETAEEQAVERLRSEPQPAPQEKGLPDEPLVRLIARHILEWFTSREGGAHGEHQEAP